MLEKGAICKNKLFVSRVCKENMNSVQCSSTNQIVFKAFLPHLLLKQIQCRPDNSERKTWFHWLLLTYTTCSLICFRKRERLGKILSQRRERNTAELKAVMKSINQIYIVLQIQSKLYSEDNFRCHTHRALKSPIEFINS